MSVGIEGLFTSALGLVPPWEVDKVDLDTARRRGRSTHPRSTAPVVAASGFLPVRGLAPRRCAAGGLRRLRQDYGGSTLAQRLHLSTEELGPARQQLIDLDLIAYRAPLYQVLAVPGTTVAPRATPSAPTPAGDTGGLVSLAQLLEQLERRRARL